MKFFSTIKVLLAVTLFSLVVVSISCDSYGGADVYLENISIGSVSVEGKPVTGLPTQKVSIVLKTGANKVVVSQSGGKTIIKLQPSGAVITSSSDGLSFTGVKPEQVEMKWATDNTTK
jgi:hypothetical protein